MTGLESKATPSIFAPMVGASKSALAGLCKRGLLAPGGTLGEWLRAYCEHLRGAAAGRAADGSLAQERQGLTAAKRKRAELELRLREGELLIKADVAHAVATIAGDVIVSYENLRGRLDPILNADQRHALRNEILSARREVAASVQRRGLGQAAPADEKRAP